MDGTQWPDIGEDKVTFKVDDSTLKDIETTCYKQDAKVVEVVVSCEKQNKKGKLQKRYLAVTNEGIYNYHPGKKRIARRISFDNLTEYDYVFYLPNELPALAIAERVRDIVSYYYGSSRQIDLKKYADPLKHCELSINAKRKSVRKPDRNVGYASDDSGVDVSPAELSDGVEPSKSMPESTIESALSTSPESQGASEQLHTFLDPDDDTHTRVDQYGFVEKEPMKHAPDKPPVSDKVDAPPSATTAERDAGADAKSRRKSKRQSVVVEPEAVPDVTPEQLEADLRAAVRNGSVAVVSDLMESVSERRVQMDKGLIRSARILLASAGNRECVRLLAASAIAAGNTSEIETVLRIAQEQKCTDIAAELTSGLRRLRSVADQRNRTLQSVRNALQKRDGRALSIAMRNASALNVGEDKVVKQANSMLPMFRKEGMLKSVLVDAIERGEEEIIVDAMKQIRQYTDDQNENDKVLVSGVFKQELMKGERALKIIATSKILLQLENALERNNEGEVSAILQDLSGMEDDLGLMSVRDSGGSIPQEDSNLSAVLSKFQEVQSEAKRKLARWRHREVVNDLEIATVKKDYARLRLLIPKLLDVEDLRSVVTAAGRAFVDAASNNIDGLIRQVSGRGDESSIAETESMWTEDVTLMKKTVPELMPTTLEDDVAKRLRDLTNTIQGTRVQRRLQTLAAIYTPKIDAFADNLVDSKADDKYNNNGEYNRFRTALKNMSETRLRNELDELIESISVGIEEAASYPELLPEKSVLQRLSNKAMMLRHEITVIDYLVSRKCSEDDCRNALKGLKRMQGPREPLYRQLTSLADDTSQIYASASSHLKQLMEFGDNIDDDGPKCSQHDLAMKIICSLEGLYSRWKAQAMFLETPQGRTLLDGYMCVCKQLGYSEQSARRGVFGVSAARFETLEECIAEVCSATVDEHEYLSTSFFTASKIAQRLGASPRADIEKDISVLQASLNSTYGNASCSESCRPTTVTVNDVTDILMYFGKTLSDPDLVAPVKSFSPGFVSEVEKLRANTMKLVRAVSDALSDFDMVVENVRLVYESREDVVACATTCMSFKQPSKDASLNDHVITAANVVHELLCSAQHLSNSVSNALHVVLPKFTNAVDDLGRICGSPIFLDDALEDMDTESTGDVFRKWIPIATSRFVCVMKITSSIENVMEECNVMFESGLATAVLNGVRYLQSGMKLCSDGGTARKLRSTVEQVEAQLNPDAVPEIWFQQSSVTEISHELERLLSIEEVVDDVSVEPPAPESTGSNPFLEMSLRSLVVQQLPTQISNLKSLCGEIGERTPIHEMRRRRSVHKEFCPAHSDVPLLTVRANNEMIIPLVQIIYAILHCNLRPSTIASMPNTFYDVVKYYDNPISRATIEALEGEVYEHLDVKDVEQMGTVLYILSALRRRTLFDVLRRLTTDDRNVLEPFYDLELDVFFSESLLPSFISNLNGLMQFDYNFSADDVINIAKHVYHGSPTQVTLPAAPVAPTTISSGSPMVPSRSSDRITDRSDNTKAPQRDPVPQRANVPVYPGEVQLLAAIIQRIRQHFESGNPEEMDTLGDDMKCKTIRPMVMDLCQALTAVLFNGFKDTTSFFSRQRHIWDMIQDAAKQGVKSVNVLKGASVGFPSSVLTVGEIVSKRFGKRGNSDAFISDIKFRTWVCYTLNYQALDAYFDCILTNDRILSKFYAEDAIVFQGGANTYVRELIASISGYKFCLALEIQ